MNKNKTVNIITNVQDNYKTGTLFMLLSCLAYTIMTVLIKAVGHLPLMEITLFRSLPTMLIIPLVIKKNHLSFWGNNKPILWLSGIFGTIGIMASFYSVRMMFLTDALTIEQLSPLFVFFLAGIFLKEKLSIGQFPFFIFAFLGGLLVIKPGLRLDMFPALIALLAAISYAVIQIILRYLRLTDHYLVIVNYLAYITGMVSLIILLVQKNFQFPGLTDSFVLILLGGLDLLAQISFTKAYQFAPANRISIFSYSIIIFGTILSLLIFKEIPDLLSIGGAFLIIISGYLNYKWKTKD